MAKAPAYLLFCLFAITQSTESVFTTGLPQISSEFNITPGLAQLSSSIYFFGFAVGILVLGRVSDYFGRKPVVIFGLSLFLLTSFICFFVNDIYHLIALRFLQAFGGSVGSVIAQAMARDSYKGENLSKLYAMLSAGIALMPALGSFVGGNIVGLFGWRYNFLYLFTIVVLILVGCIYKLPETNPNIGRSDFNKFFKILKIMIQDKKLLCYGGIIGGFNGIYYSFFIEAPFIFISKLKLHPSKFAYLIMLISFSAFCGSNISRFLQSKGIDGKIIIESGLILSIFSCFTFLILGAIWSYGFMPDDSALKILILPMLAQSVCFTTVMPLILRYSLEDYTKVNGSAGSIFGMMYYSIVAFINYITSRIHSETITKFCFFIFCLSLGCYFLFKHSKKKFLNFENPYREDL